MAVSTATLGRAAGACAATAGALFIFIQLIHPADELASVTTTGWKVTHLLTLAMAVLGLIGVSGIYFGQVKRAGMLGLVGWLVYSSFFLVVLAWNFVEVVVMPLIVDDAPTLVSDLLALPGGGDVVGDVGGFAVANLLAAGTYLLGGILFGIATFRARVFASWAAGLLVAGCASAFLVPLLPHSVDRLAAVPVGVALIGLGWSRFHHEVVDMTDASSPADAVAVR